MLSPAELRQSHGVVKLVISPAIDRNGQSKTATVIEPQRLEVRVQERKRASHNLMYSEHIIRGLSARQFL